MLVRSSGIENKTQEQVLLVDTKEPRLTFGVEQKRERENKQSPSTLGRCDPK